MESHPRDRNLVRVIEDASDIAEQTGDRLHTGHLLFGFFTTENQAEPLLLDRGINEDRLLELVERKDHEPRYTVRDLILRAEQIAAGCGAQKTHCLHVLVAITRFRQSVAYRLLERTQAPIRTLRAQALSRLTGTVPKWYARTDSAQPTSAAGRRAESARLYRAQALKWSPPLLASAHNRRLPPHRPTEKKSTRSDRHSGTPSGNTDAKIMTVPPPAAPSVVARTPISTQEPVPINPDTCTQDPDPALPWLLSPDEYPWLTRLGRNLSAEAARGELDRLVEREQEIAHLIDILGKRRSNNPCIIGEPGVGKTAIVEGLASRLVRNPPAGKLKDRVIISLDVGALLVGTHLRGSFSEKLRGIKEEVRESDGRIIIFFDELHTLVGAGATGDGPQDAANELKSALARGAFGCIGATTCDEYAKHIEPDAALKRRFVPLLIREPSLSEAVEMLKGVEAEYADHHQVSYEDAAIRSAVNLSARFITDRNLPDKAIALIDLAGSRAARDGQKSVTQEDVARLVSERTEIPVERLLSSDRSRLLHLEADLEREIIGHRKQLHRVAEVIRRNAAGFASQRPLGVFLFVGPTGVGKTETAKAISKILHGTQDAMIRLDLSEFSESHAVAKLIGAPPGYVGYETGGQLTEAVRRQPGRVILFDEIEKAHPDVLQILLQILDDGRLSDGHGRTVSFTESIVILTSNLGADLADLKRPIGFQQDDKKNGVTWVEGQILERAETRLPAELWGRMEEKLVFAHLTQKEIRAVAQLLASASSLRLFKERGIRYALDDAAIGYLVDQGGFDMRLGARPMRHILARIVEAPIAARILEGRVHADEEVIVSTHPDGGLAFLIGEDQTSLSQRPSDTF